MKSRSKLLLEKSIAAMISAIEIYNKPDFKYREETFSVLCINAWELLLKAKVLNLAGNQLSSLYKMEYATLKSGKKSKNKQKITNRSGNPLSISLFEAHRVITEDYGVKLKTAILDNISSIVEIRDNSIHFVNNDVQLSHKVQELGTASLRNYLNLVNDWFGDKLSKYNFYLMPISFYRSFNSAKNLKLNPNERKLLDYIKDEEKKYDDEETYGEYNFTLKIDLKFQKVKSNDGLPVQITNDPNAPTVNLVEEDIADNYPWDYSVLTTRLTKRYSDFKINKKYHELRKRFEKQKKYIHIRYLNPKNKNGGSKKLYNPNIQSEFDRYYSKKA